MKVGAYWFAWLACALYVALGGLLVLLTAWTTPELALGTAINSVLAAPFPLMGVLLVARRPAHPIGWLLCGAWLLMLLGFLGLGYAQSTAVNAPDMLASGVASAWLGGWLEKLGLGLLPFLLLLFPDGRLPSRRWRPLAWLGAGVAGAWAVAAAIAPGVLRGVDGNPLPIENPFGFELVGGLIGPFAGLGGALVFVVALAGVGSLLMRFRRARGDERQQIKWAAYAGVVMLTLIGINTALGYNNVAQVAKRDPAFLLLNFVLWGLTFAVLPLAMGLAILKYHLWDIDRFISRTVVYGVMWLAIAGAYIGGAALFGLAVGERLPLSMAIAGTIVATFVFQPARHALERLADRLVFGERLGGYELLARFGSTLDQTVDSHQLAEVLARSVRRGLGVHWARVVMLRHADAATSWEPVAADGIDLLTPSPAAASAPLIHGNTRVGVLECGPKVDGAFTHKDQELLITLGRQAALALRNARLTAELAERVDELAASRVRLVKAEDAGRRRLERDIHDGVQQELVAMMAKVRLSRNQLARDPTLAQATLGEVQEDLRQTLDDVRELAAGIHPAVLSDRGLLDAIDARIGRLPLAIAIDAGDLADGKRYPAALEGTAYFVVCEALANVLKHAAARHATVRLASQPGSLCVEVADDGCGFDPANVTGTGLRGLADRLEALGGTLSVLSQVGAGTRLRAELPVLEGGRA